MEIADIAKQCSISTRTVTRRLEQMRQNHILEFTILKDLGSELIVLGTGYYQHKLRVRIGVNHYKNSDLCSASIYKQFNTCDITAVI